MALLAPTAHPPRVSHDEGVQRGLPGVLPEEEPLPSERVLSGELLTERRREAMAGMREALGSTCPEGYAPEEWRVTLAVLAPVGTGRTGGVGARNDRARLARECFPGLAAPAALRAFLEVAARPHVVQVVNDVRALEGLDVLEQRALLREGLWVVFGLSAGLPALVAVDPSGGAKVAAAVVQAAKALMALDNLAAPKPAAVDPDAPSHAGPSPDMQRALAEKVARTVADLRARRGE